MSRESQRTRSRLTIGSSSGMWGLMVSKPSTSRKMVPGPMPAGSPFEMMSMPISTCFLTSSLISYSTRSGGVGGGPMPGLPASGMNSLPVCVVRIRSVLRFTCAMLAVGRRAQLGPPVETTQGDENRPFRVTPALPVGRVAQLPLRQPIREAVGRCAGDGIHKRACWRSWISRSGCRPTIHCASSNAVLIERSSSCRPPLTPCTARALHGGRQPDEPPDDRGNPTVNFRGEKRSNATHQSTTDPEARLAKKGRGFEAKLAFMGHALMENRHGRLVDFQLTHATGTAERDVVPQLLYDATLRGFHPRTLGADKAYDARECVAAIREHHVTPHVAQNTSDDAAPSIGAPLVIRATPSVSGSGNASRTSSVG